MAVPRIPAWFFACILALGAIRPALAIRPEAELCRSAIGMTERTTGVPDRLMQAVSVVESGRRDADGTVWPWPWTINVEGVGEVYETKAAVIAAVQRHQAEGARSIDVGCMQVNIKHHPEAFASLEEAFDPAANARYAARFLQQLLGQTGSWPRAVAGYHSLTPDIGADYARKVLAVWARPEMTRTGNVPPGLSPQYVPGPGALTASGNAVAGAPAAVASLPGSAPARMISIQGSATSGMTGRTLASYRALPTRPIAMVMLRAP